MSCAEFTLRLDKHVEGFNPLLPYVAGILEDLDEGSHGDICRQLELDLNRKVSSSDIGAALESGVKLGIFSIRREFKVCREFTTKELKKIKQIGDRFAASKRFNTLATTFTENGKSLMEFVKREREERRRKLAKRRKAYKLRIGMDYEDANELSKYLCQRCKKSLEKEMLSRNASPASVYDGTSRPTSPTSNDSKASQKNGSSESATNEAKESETSRLLVQKGPLETEPPYYDIFT